MKASILLALSLCSSAFAAVARRTGKVQYAGVNIAGCDFGLQTDGSVNGQADCPTIKGPSQMQGFKNNGGMNMFRLPIGWQYAVNNKAGGPLDNSFMAKYDPILKSCLDQGAKCIIDLHNYAHWNGQVVGQSGQSGCSVSDLVSFWTQIVKRYESNSNFKNIVFGVMNEPHDVEMNIWANATRAVVTGIRLAGAKSQMILLPGTGFTSAGGFETISAPALSKVTNPDGTTTGLVYDVHKYFDSDQSGQSSSCADNDHINDAFMPLIKYLRRMNRQALVSETGGGNGGDCASPSGPIGRAMDCWNENSDVILGVQLWAQGNFAPGYPLYLTPESPLYQMISAKFKG